jgi:ABC-2 type transport system ATP-binding protein
MNASHGFLTMQSNNMEALQNALEGNTAFGTVKREGDFIIAYLNNPMDASEVNKLLFEKGITLSHLVKRKESLEEQFLELTKQN